MKKRFEQENAESTETGKGKPLFRRSSIKKLFEGKIIGGKIMGKGRNYGWTEGNEGDEGIADLCFLGLLLFQTSAHGDKIGLAPIRKGLDIHG